MMKIQIWMLLPLLAIIFSTCGPRFDPETLINRTRVIGIRVEPPEIVVGAQAAVIVGLVNPKQKKYKTSFVVDPDHYYPTQFSNGTLIAEGTNATFIAPLVLAPGEPSRAILLEVQLDDGNQVLKYRKRIIVYAQNTVDANDINTNPVHKGITLSSSTVAPSNSKPGDDPEHSISLKANVEDKHQLAKDMQYRWYSTFGKLTRDAGHTSKWYCTEAIAQTATIYSVVRDLRGGMVWTNKKVTCK